MTADDLRAVAADIREKANAATPGPWAVDPDRWAPPGWREEVGYLRIVAGEPNPISGIRQKVVSTDGADSGSDHDRLHYADARHIADWHPAVALAVADWLLAVALRADEMAATLLNGPEVREHIIANNITGYSQALGFIKAWWGES